MRSAARPETSSPVSVRGGGGATTSVSVFAEASCGSEAGQLRPAAHRELLEGRRQVVPHRSLSEVQAGSDLPVAEAFGGQEGDVALA